MKRKLLSIILAIVLAFPVFSGCKYVDTSPKITLYSDHSLFIDDSIDTCDRCLPNYRLSTAGDVPYVELEEFLYAIDWCIGGFSATRSDDGLFGIVRNDTVCITLDAKRDLLTIKRYDMLVYNGSNLNNGVGPDVCGAFPDNDKPVHGSPLSRTIGERKDVVYNLKKYEMDIVEQDGKCYFPYNVVANLLFLHYYNDVVYNGIDFYLSNTITTDTDSMTYSSYYASEGNFTFMKMFMHPYPANDGEAYRFVYADPRYGDYFVINLLEGGTGYGFYALSPDMTFDEREKNYAYYTFDWYGDEYGAFADVNLVSDKPGVGKYFGYIKIPFEVGYSGNKRSPSLIKYNYNVLKFQFENLYGLRAEKGYTDFEDAVEKAGVKEGLMSDDAFEYDYAIAKFVCGYIDDFHSWMDIRCAFWNAADKVYLASYEYEVFGEKYNRVWETKFYYYDVRSQVLSDKYGLNSDEELGLFFEGNTAVIRFDVFKAQNMKNEYVDCTFDELKDVVLSSTNIFVDNCFKFISENPQIENVVFDLSGCNGGAIWLCPYIAAYFTSDPYRLEENTLTGEIMELHYTVDINHDGVYGGVGDTYEGKYNFFLLTSEGTFSAGTLFAGFAREAGVTIIGKPTAGGAGDPLGYADACGSCHVTTGALKQVYYDNGKYISADYGVPIDYELDVEYWYDLSELVAFINGIK